MNTASRRGLIFSIILHCVVILAWGAFYLFKTHSNRKIVKHTFKLQTIPRDLEKSKLVAKLENKVVPEKIIKPKNENPIKEKINPEPKTVKPKKTTISYKEFESKQKPVKKKEVKTVAQIIEIPKLNKKIENELERKLLSIQDIKPDDLIDYENYLYGMVDGAWDCPKKFEGYKNGACFVFEVDVSGRIVKVKMLQTSGSKLFDDSIQEAFRKIAKVRPNPLGKTAEFQLTFTKK
ncbi:MAG: hypothetical protein C5B43_02030 [Verrucomicrobia bacterium]|nr:MAG: hypothetical protein C5B43_02030 [Verrucomicrobiota bacterium]